LLDASEEESSLPLSGGYLNVSEPSAAPKPSTGGYLLEESSEEEKDDVVIKPSPAKGIPSTSDVVISYRSLTDTTSTKQRTKVREGTGTTSITIHYREICDR